MFTDGSAPYSLHDHEQLVSERVIVGRNISNSQVVTWPHPYLLTHIIHNLGFWRVGGGIRIEPSGSGVYKSVVRRELVDHFSIGSAFEKTGLLVYR